MTDLMSRIEAAVDALEYTLRNSSDNPLADDVVRARVRAALLALIAEVVKDAERFQWCTAHLSWRTWGDEVGYCGVPPDPSMIRKHIDDYITEDAARAKEEGRE